MAGINLAAGQINTKILTLNVIPNNLSNKYNNSRNDTCGDSYNDLYNNSCNDTYIYTQDKITQPKQNSAKIIKLDVILNNKNHNSDNTNYSECFYSEPDKKSNEELLRKIPDNVDQWCLKNKITTTDKLKKIELHNKSNNRITTTKIKCKKKQFIEIDILYGDIDRMLILLKFCYPQLNNVPENNIRNEIEKFLKHLSKIT